MVVFCIYLDELQSALCSQSTALFVSYSSLFFEIVLVANQENFHVWIAIHLDLIEPVLDMGKSLFSGDVIHEQGANGTSVVWPGNGPEIFLACSVPDLQFDILILDRYGLGAELNSNGYIMGGAGFSLNKLKNDTGLAHPGVSDDDELEEVMVRIHWLIMRLKYYYYY